MAFDDVNRDNNKIGHYIRKHDLNKLLESEHIFVASFLMDMKKYQEIANKKQEQIVWAKFLYPLFIQHYQSKTDLVLLAKQFKNWSCFNLPGPPGAAGTIEALPRNFWQNCLLTIHVETVSSLFLLTTFFLSDLGLEFLDQEFYDRTGSPIQHYTIRFSQPVSSGTVILPLKLTNQSINLSNLFEHEQTTDFRLISNRKWVQLHKVILYLRGGNYFVNLFDSETIQSLEVGNIDIQTIHTL